MIEETVYTYFLEVAQEIGADFEPMYQTPNPSELYGMVTNRISAGVPCVFCRVIDIASNSQDTSAQVYNSTVQVEIILAQVPLQEFDRNIFEREIFTIRDKFINEVRNKPIEIQHDPRALMFNFTSLGRSLFRDENIDALALTCNRNLVIDFLQSFT